MLFLQPTGKERKREGWRHHNRSNNEAQCERARWPQDKSMRIMSSDLGPTVGVTGCGGVVTTADFHGGLGPCHAFV